VPGDVDRGAVFEERRDDLQPDWQRVPRRAYGHDRCRQYTPPVMAVRHGLGLGVRPEHEYRSLAAFIIEVLVGGPYLRQLRPVAVQFMPGRRPRPHPGRATADLDLGVRIGAEVQDPRVRSLKAGVDVTDDKAIAVTDVKQRDRPRFPGPAPRRRQEQDGGTAGQRDPATGPAVKLTLERRDEPANRKHSHTSAAKMLGEPKEGLTDPVKGHTPTLSRLRPRRQGQKSSARLAAELGIAAGHSRIGE
jgi:hypothetical protein